MQDSTKRLLGIDYGSKRVGLAISDEGRQFALPLEVVPNTDSLAQDIDKIAKQNNVGVIVIGESRDYKGVPNKIFEAASRLKGELEVAGYTVIMEPEFMTSVQAERWQGKNDKSDASAAALILQSFLDKKR